MWVVGTLTVGAPTTFFRHEVNCTMHFKCLPCNMSGIVYSLHCTICSKEYVGETSRPATVMLGEHLGNVPTAQQWLAANPGKDIMKSDNPLSMWAIHACTKHPGIDIAEHTAMGLVRKTRSYGHRKCTEGSYFDVVRPECNQCAGGCYGSARRR